MTVLDNATVFAILAAVLTVTKAGATCQEVWDPPIADRPEITCASFTEALLLSLRGSTKEQVIKAMNAQGIPRNDGGPLLHYASPQEYLGGDMNFVFGRDGHVVRIFGFAQSNVGDNFGPSMEFIWNPDPELLGKLGRQWTGGCSDLPGHVWPACNKKR